MNVGLHVEQFYFCYFVSTGITVSMLPFFSSEEESVGEFGAVHSTVYNDAAISLDQFRLSVLAGRLSLASI